MTDIHIRITGRAGRITLNRPKALNALTYDMCLAMEQALLAWLDDPVVDMVVIDATGDRAFCAGGDIADLYASDLRSDYAYGQTFWADEYRLNALIATYPKPYVAFMQGFTMGGGVGVSCHGSHRIVGETSQIAMPECGIGLVPDVGGSLLLSRAPAGVGAYLGLTATRMGPADAIFAGFADMYIPQSLWPDLIETLEQTGSTDALVTHDVGPSDLERQAAKLAQLFVHSTLPNLVGHLDQHPSELAQSALKSIRRNSPLAMAATLHILANLPKTATIFDALRTEYRYTARAIQYGDFIEGIRAAVIDKDRSPKWHHTIDTVDPKTLALMTSPLGDRDLFIGERT
jgi:enoyl-CoA hydratase/carnithine racemase